MSDLCPTEVLESTEIDGRTEDSLKNVRSHLDRGASLDEQMLVQAGYGESG